MKNDLTQTILTVDVDYIGPIRLFFPASGPTEYIYE